MMQPDEHGMKKAGEVTQSVNLENLLEERERLEELIRNKFTKTITVMFTDFKGSTSIAESEGDMFSRMLIKKHNDIVFPLIESCRGVLVKTMGDGTLSYFMQASDAVRAAVTIQKEIKAFNLSGKSSLPILIRIGMNTGMGIVEKHDIFGDVVNVASRFESIAGPGEIYISEYTFDALSDKEEFYCRHIDTTGLKGKKDVFKVYKVFWSETEIEEDRARPAPVVHEEGRAEGAGPGVAEPQTGGSERARVAPEHAIILQKAEKLRERGELIEMFLYCEEFIELSDMGDLYQAVKNDLRKNDRIETLLNGKKAVWFFRETITAGRLPDADFVITNQAFARVAIRIGIRNGEGVLKVESRGIDKIHKTEVQRGSKTETIKPDVEYLLGKEGKIVFAVCFPFEYRVYKGRFLVLNALNPQECIERQFNFKLSDIWKEFESESARFVVIGI